MEHRSNVNGFPSGHYQMLSYAPHPQGRLTYDETPVSARLHRHDRFGPGRGGPTNREAPVTPVPFERILRSNQEPQNWLTYSGSLNSQRHSGLKQISPENAANLVLKWVF